MARMTTCPDCGRTLFAPSDSYSPEQMLDGHRRTGRCGHPVAAAERVSLRR